jgi:hypothetical protein
VTDQARAAGELVDQARAAGELVDQARAAGELVDQARAAGDLVELLPTDVDSELTVSYTSSWKCTTPRRRKMHAQTKQRATTSERGSRPQVSLLAHPTDRALQRRRVTEGPRERFNGNP